MRTKWFENPRTLEELKKQYRKLAMEHHPDIGGLEQDMKEINNEYQTLFHLLKNTHTNAKGEVYTTDTEVKEKPAEFIEIINKLIHFENVLIEICGSWLWLSGNTKPYKEILKELKFRWSKNKSAWYYHTEDYVKKGKKTYTMNEIRNLWGSQEVETEEQARITA